MKKENDKEPYKLEDSYVGIFFFINGKLITYKEHIKETDSDVIDVNKGHFELFNTLEVSLDYEYSMFPRGRVLYKTKEKCFYVYADKTILKNEYIKENIKKEFKLLEANVKFKGDAHYKTLNY